MRRSQSVPFHPASNPNSGEMSFEDGRGTVTDEFNLFRLGVDYQVPTTFAALSLSFALCALLASIGYYACLFTGGSRRVFAVVAGGVFTLALASFLCGIVTVVLLLVKRFNRLQHGLPKTSAVGGSPRRCLILLSFAAFSVLVATGVSSTIL